MVFKNLHVRPNPNGTYKLLAPYVYEDVEVPKGFNSNGANIPRLVWIYIPPFKPEILPAIFVHDYLCEQEEYRKADVYLNSMLKTSPIKDDERFVIVAGVMVYHKVRYVWFSKIRKFFNKGKR